MVNAKATLCQCNSSANLGPLPSDGVRHSMEAAVEVLLRGLGEDVNREGLRDTPRRVAKAWLDIASGYSQECNRAFGKALFHEPIVSTNSSGMVVVRDITFAAISEHTLLPFHGRCHIAYAPRDGVILGLSKLARVTKCLASKLQQQEAFTGNLMAAVQSEVGPHGVAVVVVANHLGTPCQPETQVTSAVSGCFEDGRSGMLLEFLTLLRLSGISAVGALLGGSSSPAAAAAAAAPPTAAAVAAAPQLQHFVPAATSSEQCAACELEQCTGVGRLEMAAAVKALLEGVGEAPGRVGLKGSAERYVDWLFSATAGYHMSLPVPACTSRTAAAAAAAAAGAGAAAAAAGVDAVSQEDGSPEAPATPADHTPDASCASSDDMSADEPGCSLGASPTSAELYGPASVACQLSGDLAQHLQQQQQQQHGSSGSGSSDSVQQIHTFSAQFASQCEHHLLPFYGTLHLAYTLPAGKEGSACEAAVSQQLQHIVDMYSRRLQVQERLSHQVADAALGTLGASAVLVVIDSAHMCMVARGVEKHASTTLTTASRGLWAEDAAARTQAMGVLLAGAAPEQQ